jgi:uncharacterized protein
MKALITGASSGIGKDMAYVLADIGYDLILVARSKDLLDKIKKDIKTNTKVIVMDLSDSKECIKLHNMVKEDNIDVLINNAGFGLFGEFDKTSLKDELSMIDLNIKAVHILTKLFLRDFKEKDAGYILNVASMASFQPGPLMATYYATKAYVLRMTLAVYGELKESNSKVVISALCPGPVDTNFNKVAKVSFAIKPLSSMYVAKYGIRNMFKKKLIIIPGFISKVSFILSGFVPVKLGMKVIYNVQRKKDYKNG